MDQKKNYQLPKAFAEKWIEALESGEYPQTVGKLYRDVVSNRDDGPRAIGYCCLGVAGKICGVSDNKLKVYGFLYHFIEGCQDQCDEKPSYGIPFELSGREEQLEWQLANALVNLNDTKRYTFPQIAEWIKENVELYE